MYTKEEREGILWVSCTAAAWPSGPRATVCPCSPAQTCCTIGRVWRSGAAGDDRAGRRGRERHGAQENSGDEKFHTKAGFKALREDLGMSQGDLAREAWCNIQSVKRWEKEGNSWDPPARAWAALEDAASRQREAVAAALEAARATEAEAGHKPDAVEVTYFRDQAMYDEFGREEGPFGVANANARAAARALRADGYDVVFRYPSDAPDA